MAITQDGTHRFGIPDSPITINSVTYVAESQVITSPSTYVEINDDEGLPDGGVIIPGRKTYSATLQLASSNTALPTVGMAISNIKSTNFLVTEVGDTETQGEYAKIQISAIEKLN